MNGRGGGLSLNRPSGPSCDVRQSSVCVCLPLRETRFAVDGRLLVKECIANIVIPLKKMLLFQWFWLVGDRWQVIHVTHKLTWHVTYDIFDNIFFFLISFFVFFGIVATIRTLWQIQCCLYARFKKSKRPKISKHFANFFLLYSV